ncbi:1,2-dihydroxy-3-keto-5-methylthiopentene dioxygenase [Prochlorothrix hollandica]|uniref:Acireductone dioxygenase n=1 Tax=Prochlorothrix hollandica PCC 9006 = CALU 1027 TaxID=317619 RepID=A0A0M2PX98_PROHO|nr:cupin domain-containing protein [Prochlorothrix hollandica]KKJ00805.1 dioxygenase [Prochlorothrix hollandica PCC 9006 = CALU 1027]
MATLTLLDRSTPPLTTAPDITAYLQGIGLDYQQWQPSQPLGDSATSDEVLAAYGAEIETLKAAGGYVTADVIDIQPDTPNLDAMLAKFDKEHWHDEDEVRFTLAGHGIFYINPTTSPVVKVDVAAGDLLVVPRGTLHWFELADDRRIRAIRLFQDPGGWTPHYTNSGTEQQY